MATIQLPKVSFSTINPNSGSLYHVALSLDSGTYSDYYLIPISEIYGISCYIDGDGVLEFTNDPPSVIEADAATWVAWDGSSYVSPAVTGFRINRTSGTVNLKVTVKAAKD